MEPGRRAHHARRSLNKRIGWFGFTGGFDQTGPYQVYGIGAPEGCGPSSSRKTVICDVISLWFARLRDDRVFIPLSDFGVPSQQMLKNDLHRSLIKQM